MNRWPPLRPACTAKVEGRECGEPSRFIVIREDGDNSYGTGWGGTREACGEHLAAQVLAMVDGDEVVSAIVTARLYDPGKASDARSA